MKLNYSSFFSLKIIWSVKLKWYVILEVGGLQFSKSVVEIDWKANFSGLNSKIIVLSDSYSYVPTYLELQDFEIQNDIFVFFLSFRCLFIHIFMYSLQYNPIMIKVLWLQKPSQTCSSVAISSLNPILTTFSSNTYQIWVIQSLFSQNIYFLYNFLFLIQIFDSKFNLRFNLVGVTVKCLGLVLTKKICSENLWPVGMWQ